MRLIKMLGLAAAVAMAAMAFIGASSASATVLCKTTPTPNTSEAKCLKANTYGPGTIIKGTAENARLTPDGIFPDVICKHSETEAETTTTGGASATVTGTIKALNFTECITPTGPGCEVTVENLPYHAEIHWTPNTHNGVLTVKSHGEGNPGVEVICPAIIECSFNNSVFNLPVTGGNPAVVTANEVGLTIGSGVICPSSANWDASYKAVGTNTAIWVGKEEE